MSAQFLFDVLLPSVLKGGALSKGTPHGAEIEVGQEFRAILDARDGERIATPSRAPAIDNASPEGTPTEEGITAESEEGVDKYGESADAPDAEGTSVRRPASFALEHPVDKPAPIRGPVDGDSASDLRPATSESPTSTELRHDSESGESEAAAARLPIGAGTAADPGSELSDHANGRVPPRRIALPPEDRVFMQKASELARETHPATDPEAIIQVPGAARPPFDSNHLEPEEPRFHLYDPWNPDRFGLPTSPSMREGNTIAPLDPYAESVSTRSQPLPTDTADRIENPSAPTNPRMSSGPATVSAGKHPILLDRVSENSSTSIVLLDPTTEEATRLHSTSSEPVSTRAPLAENRSGGFLSNSELRVQSLPTSRVKAPETAATPIGYSVKTTPSLSPPIGGHDISSKRPAASGAQAILVPGRLPKDTKVTGKQTLVPSGTPASDPAGLSLGSTETYETARSDEPRTVVHRLAVSSSLDLRGPDREPIHHTSERSGLTSNEPSVQRPTTLEARVQSTRDHFVRPSAERTAISTTPIAPGLMPAVHVSAHPAAHPLDAEGFSTSASLSPRSPNSTATEISAGTMDSARKPLGNTSAQSTDQVTTGRGNTAPPRTVWASEPPLSRAVTASTWVGAAGPHSATLFTDCSHQSLTTPEGGIRTAASPAQSAPSGAPTPIPASDSKSSTTRVADADTIPATRNEPTQSLSTMPSHSTNTFAATIAPNGTVTHAGLTRSPEVNPETLPSKVANAAPAPEAPQRRSSYTSANPTVGQDAASTSPPDAARNTGTPANRVYQDASTPSDPKQEQADADLTWHTRPSPFSRLERASESRNRGSALASAFSGGEPDRVFAEHASRSTTPPKRDGALPAVPAGSLKISASASYPPAQPDASPIVDTPLPMPFEKAGAYAPTTVPVTAVSFAVTPENAEVRPSKADSDTALAHRQRDPMVSTSLQTRKLAPSSATAQMQSVTGKRAVSVIAADPDFTKENSLNSEVGALSGQTKVAPSVIAPTSTLQPSFTGTSQSPMKQIVDALQKPLDGSVEVELRPADLGRVRLTFIHQDGTLIVSLSAERPETLDLMRRNIDQLAQDLRQMGYERTGFDFGSANSGNTMNGHGSAAQDASPFDPPTADAAARDPDEPHPSIGRTTGLDLRV